MSASVLSDQVNPIALKVRTRLSERPSEISDALSVAAAAGGVDEVFKFQAVGRRLADLVARKRAEGRAAGRFFDVVGHESAQQPVGFAGRHTLGRHSRRLDMP